MTSDEILSLQEILSDQYKYKKLPDNLASDYRRLWQDELPKGLKLEGDNIIIYADNGEIISYGYNRIVIGDYGAFIEMLPEQANIDKYIIQPGQEYRIRDPRYSKNVKYNWLTIDGTELKIYEQKKGVVYADYKPGCYYISPHENLIFGYGINPTTKPAAQITLGFSVIPAHCGECPLYLNNIFVDDEPSWGSGISHFCPFGADYHGCLVVRPKDCPIKCVEES